MHLANILTPENRGVEMLSEQPRAAPTIAAILQLSFNSSYSYIDSDSLFSVISTLCTNQQTDTYRNSLWSRL